MTAEAFDRFDRVGLVVHPTRGLDTPLRTIAEWAGGHGAEVVQVRTRGSDREVAPEGDVAACDLVIALGGDGTTLIALQAAAAVDRPVLGVACGSLGALTATSADVLGSALDRISTGAWTPRDLPAVETTISDGHVVHGFNDLVLVRDGAGQVVVHVEVDGETFIRYAGDGLIAATPLGSTAYTLASGGPMLAPGTPGIVLTPLAPHGGVCPPLVASPGAELRVLLEPGNGGARLEVDGQVHRELERMEPVRLELRYVERHAQLVMLGEQESLFAGLRRRRLLLDSPRVLARDEREAAAKAAKAAAG